MNARVRPRRGALWLLSCALAAAAGLRGQSPGQTPAWSDEFNQAVGSSPDPAKWTYDLGGGGWGNDELETYTSNPANVSVVSDPGATDGRALAITAIQSGSTYTSARIKTEGIFSFTYGLVEARIKLPPGGQGIWPAFWMLGSDITTAGWPQCGEMDIMENIGLNLNVITGTLHGPGYSGSNGIQSTYTLPNNGNFSAGYHIFAVRWSPNQIQWLVDGNAYQTLTPASIPAGTQWVYNNSPFFILLNFAVGGDYPGNPTASTPFPQTMYVDYVRVYDLQPAAPANVAGYATPSGAAAISWTPAPAAAGSAPIASYELVRATDSAFTQNVTTVYTGASTSFTDSTVTAGTKYYYEVLSVGSDGAVSPASSATAITPQAPAGNGSGAASVLINISSRCFVGTGIGVAAAGFVISGVQPATILLRGVGPTIGNPPYNLPGVLPDPELELYDSSGDLLAINEGWSNNANAPAIQAAFASTEAFSLPAGSADSALLVTLAPGVYTAQLSGASGDTGIALIEAYSVP